MAQPGQQEVKCSVQSCSHNDKSRFCTLNDVSIGNQHHSDANKKDETVCSSFNLN